tara:strand:+ start:104 stop:1651 length:1548 start_codon:yes stop_codon:yes gene_type:complete
MAEPITSPIAGGIRAIRNTVSRSIFTGGGVVRQKDDSISSNATARNSALLSSISVQVNSVNEQVVILNKSLEVISSNLAVNSNLDRQRQAEEIKRNRLQGEGNLRNSREQSIEAKIRETLLFPVKRIGAKLKLGLSSLTNAFLIITTGWLTSQAFEFIKAMIDDNEKLMRDISNKVIGGLSLLGGGFVLFASAMGALMKGVRRLSGNILTFAFQNLIKTPFQFVKRVIGDLIKGTFPNLFKGYKPSSTKPFIPNLPKNKNPNVANPKAPNLKAKFGGPGFKSLALAAILEGYQILNGKDWKNSATDVLAGFITAAPATGIVASLGLTNPFTAIPAGLVIGSLLFSGGYNLREVLGLDFAPKNKGEEEKTQIDDINTKTQKEESFNLSKRIDDSSGLNNKRISPFPKDPISDVTPTLGAKDGDLLALANIKEDSTANSIVPKSNKIKTDNVAKNLGSLKEPAPIALPLPTTDVGSNEGGLTSGSGKSGAAIPAIPSSNRDNSYIFLAFKNYQVVPI